MTPESGPGGDWSKCITATTDGTEGKLTDGNAGGNLVIKNVDGAKFYRVTFDLLNQMSSRSYSLNAQMQTESYRNVLRRYVMFNISFRLNKEPKK